MPLVILFGAPHISLANRVHHSNPLKCGKASGHGNTNSHSFSRHAHTLHLYDSNFIVSIFFSGADHSGFDACAHLTANSQTPIRNGVNRFCLYSVFTLCSSLTIECCKEFDTKSEERKEKTILFFLDDLFDNAMPQATDRFEYPNPTHSLCMVAVLSTSPRWQQTYHRRNNNNNNTTN